MPTQSINLKSPAFLLERQRSHILLSLTNSASPTSPEHNRQFGSHMRAWATDFPTILSATVYERDPTDVTGGAFPPLPFGMLTILNLAIDGANAAEPIIDALRNAHLEIGASEPATWLFYPSSERVGGIFDTASRSLVIAFANATIGNEEEFREFYATGHVRHAQSLPPLVSGQCYQRTRFQKAGSHSADFSTIAIYELEGNAQDLLDAFKQVVPGSLSFPTLDKERFSEALYHPVPIG